MTDTEAPSLLPLPQALRILCEVHLRYWQSNDPWQIDIGVSPHDAPWIDPSDYTRAWEAVRASVIAPTPPSSALGEEIRKLARELREKATNQLADLSVCSDANMADRKQFNDDCAMWGDIIRLCNAVLGEGK